MSIITLRKISQYTARGISPKYVEGDGLIVLNQKCIRDQKINLGPSRLTDKARKISTEKILKRFDVLINSTGVGTLGRVAQLTDNMNATADSHVTIFRPNEYVIGESKKVDPLYVGFCIRNEEKFIESLGTGATGQTELSKDSILDKVSVWLPEYTTQTRIASVLSAYDDLIENNEKRIKALEEMAQLLYTEWFVKFKFPGHEKVKLIDSGTEYGKIPEGWEVRSLGEISDLIKEKYSEKSDFNLPLVDMARINSRSLIITNIGKASELSTSRIIFEKGDVLFGSIRPYLHKVALAPFKGITNISVFVLRAKEEHLKSFQTVVLSSDVTIRWANGRSTGTKMPVIKWELLKQMPVLIPRKEILVKFELKLSPIFECISQLSIRNNSLSKTRDLLIPQLITGKRELKNI